jgi:protein ImuB
MFAAIFVPDFPVQAIVRAEPELRERAVAIVGGVPPLLHVVACNERARKAGVELGMTPLEAEGRFASHVSAAVCGTTAKDGGGWQIRRRSPAQEAAAHAALFDCACTFSPRVEDNIATRDTVVLDLQGLDRLFGSPVQIARELARHAAELGLETHVAVAANIEAALYAARGFTGVSLIPPSEEAERLGVLPVETLLDGGDIPAGRTVAGERASEILTTLARWGVRTFRALAALPESAVRQRLGEVGVRLQGLARGASSRPLVPAERPLKFEETVEPEYPVVLLEPLAFLLNRMLEQLCTRLAARVLAAHEIRLRLDLAAISDSGFGIGDLPDGSEVVLGRVNPKSPFPLRTQENCRSLAIARDDKAIPNLKSQIPNPNSQEYVLRFPAPMADSKVFLKLLQLELQTKPPGAPVKRICLAAKPAPPRFTQGGLFLPAAPEPEKLELTLARLNNIVSGFQFPVSSTPATGGGKRETENLRVGVAELLDTYRPDAFRMKKFSAINFAPVPHFPLSVSRRTDGAVAAGNRKWETGNVLRRFRPSRPVWVKLENGCPKTVSGFEFSVSSGRATGNGKPETGNSPVVWAAGPWHESGEWWSEDPWSREVWDVAVDQAGAIAIYRVFRDVIRDEWFVEASYD